MQYIIKKLNNKKKIVSIFLAIFTFPIAMTIINATVLTIFNLGGYLGTFIRYLFNTVVC